MQKDRFRWPCRPAASDRNIIKAADFRFTVLTSRLIRMEYSPSGDFVDQASQKVFFRDFMILSALFSFAHNTMKVLFWEMKKFMKVTA